MKPAMVLVTGAGGFIGRHLLARLLGDGHRVLALARLDSHIPASYAGRVETIRTDDWSFDGIRQALADRSFDVVIHLAAYGVRPQDRDAAMMFTVNTGCPVALVRLAGERGAGVIAAGSSAEYAPSGGQKLLTEAASIETEKLYGASKAAGGIAASAISQALKVPLVYLRLFNVYGPGEAPHRLLPSLFRALARDETSDLSDGAQLRDFVFVGDVVEAMILAMARMSGSDVPTAIVNVCTGHACSVREFAETVARLLGKPSSLLGFGRIRRRPDDLDCVVGSGARAAQILGFSPRITLESGVAMTVDRLRERIGMDAYVV